MNDLIEELRDVGDADDPLSIGEPERSLRLRAAAAIEHLQAIVDRLRDALQDLMDWQNGPPLITWTEKWSRAMRKSREALEAAEAAKGETT
jgi:hypothetical protein